MNRRLLLTLLIWLVVLALLAWVLNTVPLRDAAAVLGRLRLWQIAVIGVMNVGVVLLFSARWWLILRAQGYRIPYVALSGYRLAAFGVSYFTPGSQFGGEPLQVMFAHRRHHISIPTASASVAVEKLVELSANFSVLAMGVALTVVQSPAFDQTPGAAALGLAVGLLSLPVAALLALGLGYRPASWLLSILPAGVRQSQRAHRMLDGIIAAEAEAAGLLRAHPTTLAASSIASLLSLFAMMGETWLAVRFLGVEPGLIDLVAITTAARIGILAPSPGGLGTLEASQVWMFEALGFDPALGLSLALIVRVRDVLFGAAGLVWGSVMLGHRLSPRDLAPEADTPAPDAPPT